MRTLRTAISGVRGHGVQVFTVVMSAVALIGLGTILVTSAVAASKATQAAHRTLLVEQQLRQRASDETQLLVDLAAQQTQLKQISSQNNALGQRAALQGRALAQVVSDIERDLNAICATIACGQKPLTPPPVVSAAAGRTTVTDPRPVVHPATTTTTVAKRHGRRK